MTTLNKGGRPRIYRLTWLMVVVTGCSAWRHVGSVAVAVSRCPGAHQQPSPGNLHHDPQQSVERSFAGHPPTLCCVAVQVITLGQPEVGTLQLSNVSRACHVSHHCTVLHDVIMSAVIPWCAAVSTANTATADWTCGTLSPPPAGMLICRASGCWWAGRSASWRAPTRCRSSRRCLTSPQRPGVAGSMCAVYIAPLCFGGLCALAPDSLLVSDRVAGGPTVHESLMPYGPACRKIRQPMRHSSSR